MGFSERIDTILNGAEQNIHRPIIRTTKIIMCTFYMFSDQFTSLLRISFKRKALCAYMLVSTRDNPTKQSVTNHNTTNIHLCHSLQYAKTHTQIRWYRNVPTHGVHTHTHTRARARVRTQTFIHTRARTHTHTHTHTHVSLHI